MNVDLDFLELDDDSQSRPQLVAPEAITVIASPINTCVSCTYWEPLKLGDWGMDKIGWGKCSLLNENLQVERAYALARPEARMVSFFTDGEYDDPFEIMTQPLFGCRAWVGNADEQAARG